jgi:hypothetical protein
MEDNGALMGPVLTLGHDFARLLISAPESKVMRFPPGAVTIMQPKTTHFAFFNEETIPQVHGAGPWEVNYVNPADDPRKKTN